MRRTALRAGLAAVCVVVAFVASPILHAPGQTAKPAASDEKTPNGAPQANSPGANFSAAPAPSTQPPTSQPETSQPATPPAQTQIPPASAAPPSAPPSSPPAKTPPAAKAPAPAPSPPATKSVLDKYLILGILGKEVKSAKGEDMGRVVDVIVDWTGQTRAAIIDFGGFLGVGSRRIAVAWKALHFEPEQKGDQITLELTRDQVKAAPEYKEGQPVVVLGPSGATEPIPFD